MIFETVCNISNHDGLASLQQNTFDISAMAMGVN